MLFEVWEVGKRGSFETTALRRIVTLMEGDMLKYNDSKSPLRNETFEPIQSWENCRNKQITGWAGGIRQKKKKSCSLKPFKISSNFHNCDTWHNLPESYIDSQVLRQ